MGAEIQFFIITTKDHAPTARKAAINISALYAQPEIHFIVPGIEVPLFDEAMKDVNVIIHDERRFSPHLQLDAIRQWGLSHFPSRANWYYQQFLKLAVAENNFSHERFVIWDGDTVPYRPLRFFEDGAPCFVIHQKEFHEPYFETNKQLISVDRRTQPLRYSAISQHMPVVKASMLRLLDRLKSKEGHHWIETIRQAIEGREGISLFSEYELYADYMISVEANCAFDTVAWYRYGQSCTPDQRMFLNLTNAFCSFESWDRPQPFRLDRWCSRWVKILRETKRKPLAVGKIATAASSLSVR
jgi:hypothetical protein